ncbi:hypothetical protein M422DRAFT_56537 [Sphaerobolus stellatus SS14]|uniref:Uncharacterized protein n=1 Tax=Sphaerobolus stellatus (strain SS14) TaxID=990650 RepID=A0A0C9UFW3_SPHS4|nr:hypothetical protein M422DRAFT_56537 [Sphaerobolus stellatus SS14]
MDIEIEEGDISPNVGDGPTEVAQDTLQPTNDAAAEEIHTTHVPSQEENDDADLLHLIQTINQRIDIFAPPEQLQFAIDAQTTSYQSIMTLEHPFNQGICTLDVRSRCNLGILSFERALIDALATLNHFEARSGNLESLKAQCSSRIRLMIYWLDDIKRNEWERQRRFQEGQSLENAESDGEGPICISTAQFREPPCQTMNSAAIICIFLVSVLHLLCRLSRRHCNFVMRVLRILMRTILGKSHPINQWYQTNIVEEVPVDVRTAISRLDLNPTLIPYACCPSCCCLYSLNKQRPNSSQESMEVDESLSGDSDSEASQSVIEDDAPGYAEFCTYKEAEESEECGARLRKSRTVLGRVYTRAIRTFYHQDLSSWLPYLLTRPGMEEVLLDMSKNAFAAHDPSILRVIWDSPTIRAFKGPDGEPFFENIGAEIRLLFSLSFDNFNPLGNKQAGKKVKSKDASLEEPSYHWLQISMLSVRLRTCAQHRQYATEWLNAESQDKRNHLFELNGIRWSELLMLDYWDPCAFTLYNVMHGWYLNVADDYVRDILGVDMSKPSGDGLFVANRPKGAPPSEQELLNALDDISNRCAAPFDTLNLPQAPPDSIRKATLFQLCERRGQRRAGTRLQMWRTLLRFYGSNKTYLTEDIDDITDPSVDTVIDKEEKAYLNAEDILLSSKRASFVKDSEKLARFKKGILLRLCTKCGIVVPSKTPKPALASKLLNKQYIAPLAAEPGRMQGGRAVIGSDLIIELDNDIRRIVIPSWVSAKPSQFYSSQHGRLKADEWRTTLLVRLVVTLPRVWGPHGGCHKLLLNHFMHLVQALFIAGGLSVVIAPTTENGGQVPTSEFYKSEFQAYLQGIIELFPTAKVKPNTHLAFHVGDLLTRLGPVHPWRCYVFERFNGLLQNIPSNMRFGEFEKTLMRTFCIGARLKALVADGHLESLSEVGDVFQSTFADNHTGSLLYERLGLESRTINEQPLQLSKPQDTTLDSKMLLILVNTLNLQYDVGGKIYGTSLQCGPNIIPLDPRVWNLRECEIDGLKYRPSLSPTIDISANSRLFAHRDSHILVRFSDSDKIIPCSIQNIVAHRRISVMDEKTLIETFLIIRRYVELEPEHCAFDFWRAYKYGAGRLCYDLLADDPEIISLNQVISHFAKTPFPANAIAGIDRPCIHVLPLNWSF